jgi:plasmid stabilization system protein ParE
MNYELVFKEEADQEITESFIWYEKQQLGLGELFLSEIDKGISLILSNPYQYAIRHNNKRAAVIKRFPFLIIYEIIENEIVIYAVFHSSRDPKIWKKR